MGSRAARRVDSERRLPKAVCAVRGSTQERRGLCTRDLFLLFQFVLLFDFFEIFTSLTRLDECMKKEGKTESTHEVTKHIKELDEVPHHWRLSGAFGIVHHDVGTTEPSRFMNVLESRMDWLRTRRACERSGARTNSLSPLIGLPFVDVVPGVYPSTPKRGKKQRERTFSRKTRLTLCLLQGHRTERETALYPPFARDTGRRRIAWTSYQTRTRRGTKQRVLGLRDRPRWSDVLL